MNYSLEADLMPIVKGEIALPNFEEQPIGHVAANIASLGHNLHPVWGYANIDGRKSWAQFFLTPAGMGSVPNSLDGGGYVLIWRGYPAGGYGGRFAICKHEKKMAPSANPSRGWHPGACVKCGLDMTIDSGD